jgi:hypothetical protein
VIDSLCYVIWVWFPGLDEAFLVHTIFFVV